MWKVFLVFIVIFIIIGFVAARFLNVRRRKKNQTEKEAGEEAEPVIGIQVEELQKIDQKGVEPTSLLASESVQTQDLEETPESISENILQPAEAESSPFKGDKGVQISVNEREQFETPEKRKRIEPEKRGGRSRAVGKETEKQSAQKPKPRLLKPEIVCWKRERQWVLAVELPDELFSKDGLIVLQNEFPLAQDEAKDNCWTFCQAVGQVAVKWAEDGVEEKAEVAFGQDGYLLFKLSGQNRGRLVKFPSSGSYLVVVPNAWKRDEELSGSPTASPEPASVLDYQAHYFDLEKGSKKEIAFITGEGKPVRIARNLLRVELIGNELTDASEDMGILYGEKPPQIRFLNEPASKEIQTIVLGEEGKGKGKWRMTFNPKPDLIQGMPPELSDRKSGWYFLRFYDLNDDLIESFDFRFTSKLKHLKIHQPCPLPLEAGHGDVSVEFLHEADCPILPIGSPQDGFQISRTVNGTILTIPPDPTKDKTRWLVGGKNGSQMEVTILVERVWWAIGEEGITPSEWKERRFTLSREDFRPKSNKTIWLKLPKPRWIDAVKVGFEQQKSRQFFSLKVTDDTIPVLLRDFGDSKEVADRTKEHRLMVWVKHDYKLVVGMIAVLPAEPTVPFVKRPDVILGKKATLNLYTMKAPRLANVLSRLQRKARGPLRMLVKEVRRKYYTCEVEHEEFVRQALCTIAFSLEGLGGKKAQVLCRKRRWVIKASLAKEEFPQIVFLLRSRYHELENSK